MTQSRPAVAAIPIVDRIAPLASTSDAWLTDIWGVMHNGIRPFADAVDACRQFRASGGTVLLLSNAPRPAQSVAAQLDRIGVARDAYDAILSSGDASRALIVDAASAGRSIGHLGPERDLPLYDGLAVAPVTLGAADVVVCTGLYDDTTETPDTYSALLGELRARDALMICANPDLTVERGQQIVYCAGAVAAAYERLGGRVVYAGKPHLPVYDLAMARIRKLRGAAVPRDRVLAIGDGIRTDIAGAHAAGVRSVFVASGVHVTGAGLDAAALEVLFDGLACRPVAAMTSLVW